MKLWQKSTTINERIAEFTVGKDRELDRVLAPFDILGSIAHITMLHSIGLLKNSDLVTLKKELSALYLISKKGALIIEPGIEDIHSQVEFLLTQKLGDIGKKIHSGRSRNDQVLVDTKMYLRWEIGNIVEETSSLFGELQRLSQMYQHVLMPGYTHMQVAMPSSFGLWFGAYAESLKDDLFMLKAAFEVVNQNPLGSAAGYGSSFPLDRQMTTQLLGFKNPNYNVVYAQMTRGKSEKSVAVGISFLAATLSKLSMDVCLYMGQNYNFFSFPDELTTGSSIMPHKKNPDVFELVRANCNKLQALPNELALLLTNLPTGYHRDLQLLKECIVPAIEMVKECMSITTFMLTNIKINQHIIEEPKYDYLFTVEKVNELVLKGVAFRDAYLEVGKLIENGTYVPNRKVKHTHIGSIGNPANDEIKSEFNTIVNSFGFEKITETLENLVESK